MVAWLVFAVVFLGREAGARADELRFSAPIDLTLSMSGRWRLGDERGLALRPRRIALPLV